MADYMEKCEKLKDILHKYTKQDCMIAFSGGVDSSLLLKLACECGKINQANVYALTLHTMLHPAADIEIAKKVAEEAGAIHIVLEVDELAQAGMLNNPVDRCYLCKKYLFEQVKKKAETLKAETIMEGTNLDDLDVYRPGIRAVRELGILSPLADAGFTKRDVRRLAEEYKISVSDRPSAPCLATRFPYGTALSYEAMKRVEKGEAFIKELGFYNVRLRVHEDVARIEVDEASMLDLLTLKSEIVSYLKEIGYVYITMDLEGFRSGSMDYYITRQ